MENPIYKMIINNAKAYIKKSKPLDLENSLNAFQISEVLAICFCTSKEKIIADLLKDDNDRSRKRKKA